MRGSESYLRIVLSAHSERVIRSAEEAGYYLSTYKQFEHKPPDLIKERVDKDYCYVPP